MFVLCLFSLFSDMLLGKFLFAWDYSDHRLAEARKECVRSACDLSFPHLVTIHCHEESCPVLFEGYPLARCLLPYHTPICESVVCRHYHYLIAANLPVSMFARDCMCSNCPSTSMRSTLVNYYFVCPAHRHIKSLKETGHFVHAHLNGSKDDHLGACASFTLTLMSLSNFFLTFSVSKVNATL